jgi:chromosome segregation ATPase
MEETRVPKLDEEKGWGKKKPPLPGFKPWSKEHQEKVRQDGVKLKGMRNSLEAKLKELERDVTQYVTLEQQTLQRIKTIETMLQTKEALSKAKWYRLVQEMIIFNCRFSGTLNRLAGFVSRWAKHVRSG